MSEFGAERKQYSNWQMTLGDSQHMHRKEHILSINPPRKPLDFLQAPYLPYLLNMLPVIQERMERVCSRYLFYS